MIGPKIKIEASCSGCTHCTSEGYACQGDSGRDVYCSATGEKKHVGDSRWDTPDWCPFLAEAKKAACSAVVNTPTNQTAP